MERTEFVVRGERRAAGDGFPGILTEQYYFRTYSNLLRTIFELVGDETYRAPFVTGAEARAPPARSGHGVGGVERAPLQDRGLLS